MEADYSDLLAVSIKIMSLVWDRFDASGGELLLALALADFADENGGSIWPSVNTLMRKTRQSRRTVQRQLADLRARHWLLVDDLDIEGGGRGRTALYHISQEWLKGGATGDAPRGAKLTPPLGDRGATGDAGGASQLRRTRGATDGAGGCAIAVTPNPSSDPPLNHPESSGVIALVPVPGTARKPKLSREAQRLSDEFELTPSRQRFAQQEGVDAQRTFAMFHDHWRAASGKGATKRDWDAAWRNWCRREAEFKRDRSNNPRGSVPPSRSDSDALRQLMNRRSSMSSLRDFRDPRPDETSDQYRKAQDEEWERRQPPAEPRFPVTAAIAALAAAKRVQS
ncbi:MAG: helix-turn-helix domain-containing protein [Steroidobacteraceae bacterium]